MQTDNNNTMIPDTSQCDQNAIVEVQAEQLPSLLDSYRDMTQEMSRYFDSLKSVDVFFAKASQRFHAEIENISQKKEYSSEDVYGMMQNLAYAAATKGVGSIYKAIKTSDVLAQIKQKLMIEGEQRLPSLRILQEKLGKSLNNAQRKLEKAMSFPRNTIEALEKPFNRLRSLMYMDMQARFLIATYEDAAKGMLQDRVPFPSMYEVNTRILYNIIMPIGSATSETQVFELRRNAIERLISSIEENFTGRLQTKPRDLLFAADSGLMAVAICDIVPPKARKTDVDGYTQINEDSMLTASMHDYIKLFQLYRIATENQEKTLAKALLSNDSLCDFVGKIIDLEEVSSQYGKKCNIYIINNVLFGVLSFLASIDRLGLKWYWSLLIGIVVFIVGMQFTPFTSLRNIVKKKLTYIDNRIHLSSMRAAGYTEEISLKEIEKSSNRIFWWTVIGAILGFFFIPFLGGLIIGALIGGWLGDSRETEGEQDFDYESIKIGSWKANILMILLIAAILYYVYILFF